MTHLFKLAYMGYFRGPECMQLKGWEFLLYLSEGFGIKVKSKIRMVTTLQQQLVAAIFECFPDLTAVGIHIGNVCIRMARNAVEIAELAISHTYIGRVYVTVYLPGYFTMRHLLLAECISY